MKIYIYTLLFFIMIFSCAYGEDVSLDLEDISRIENRTANIFSKNKNVYKYLDSLRTSSNNKNLSFFCDILSVKFNKNFAPSDKLSNYKRLAKTASLNNLDAFSKFKVKKEIATILIEGGDYYPGINQFLLGIGEIEIEPKKYKDLLTKTYSSLVRIKTLNLKEREKYTLKVLKYAAFDDYKLLATNNYNLGFFRAEDKSYEAAYKFLQKSINVSLEIEGDYTNQYSSYQMDILNFNWSNTYPLLIECFTNLNQIDSVYIYIDQAEKLYQEKKIKANTFQNFRMHIIPSLILLKEYQLVSEYVDVLLNEFENTCKSAYPMTQIYEYAAALHKVLNQKTKQIEAEKERLHYASMCDRNNDYFKRQEKDAIQQLISIYKEDKNKESAFYYQKLEAEFLKKNLSLITERNASSKLWSSFALEVERNESLYHRTLVENERSRFYWLLGVTLITIILSFYIFKLNYSLKISQKNIIEKQNILKEVNTTLSKSNHVIIEQNKQLNHQKSEIQLKLKEKLLFINSSLNEVKNIIEYTKSLKFSGNESLHLLQRKLSRLIDNNFIKEMNLQYQENHKEFVVKLCHIHPNLTSNNIKMCILLKLNMSTKEIANIESKSSQSTKVARSRLRKKLGLLDKSISLSSYLNNLEM